MYAPLPPDPLPPGPRVSSPAAPLLRLVLRVFNVALSALGLLLIAAAVWMWRGYENGGGDAPPAPPLAPEPEPVPDASMVSAAAEAAAMLAAGGRGSLGLWAWAGISVWHSKEVASFPWFIYLVGAVGAYILGAALCGLAGVTLEARRQLAAYILLLALLVLAEAGACLLMLTDNSWVKHIPDDPSGRWRDVRAFIADNGHEVRLGVMASLGAQLAALAAACWLHAIYTSAYEAWLDDREEASERVREVLARTVVQTYAGGSGSSWSARLKHKYGVEASQLEAATNAARQVAGLRGQTLADDHP